MSTKPEIGPTTDEQELQRYGEIIAHAFQFPAERAATYLDQAGRGNVRVGRIDGAVASGLVVLPFGQFFGGAAVPMAGVAAVAVAPEYRSSGIGSQMMRAAMQELHAAGCPLSALYPATQPVYRRVGYEIAGVQFELRLPTAEMGVYERFLPLRRATAADEAAIHGLYRRWAMQAPGSLDRTAFNWGRVHEWRTNKATGFVVGSADAPEGYIYYFLQPGPPGHHQHMQLTDLVALTPAAGRRLLAFIGDHRSVVESVSWNSSAVDPLLTLLIEQPFELKSNTYWMLRIVHVAAALAARGYPPDLRLELHFDVRDDVLPANNGRCVLHVAEGRGRVEPGGRGSLAIDVRGLAALYSGYLSPQQLRATGYLDAGASDRELLAAQAVFAGPMPFMRDSF